MVFGHGWRLIFSESRSDTDNLDLSLSKISNSLTLRLYSFLSFSNASASARYSCSSSIARSSAWEKLFLHWTLRSSIFRNSSLSRRTSSFFSFFSSSISDLNLAHFSSHSLASRELPGIPHIASFISCISEEAGKRPGSRSSELH